MPQKVSAKHLGQAILDSVHHGTYPDTEEIISAEFPPSAIPEALILFDHARGQIEVGPQFSVLPQGHGETDHARRLACGRQARAVPRTLMAGYRKQSSCGLTSRLPTRLHKTSQLNLCRTNSCGSMFTMLRASFDYLRESLPSTNVWPQP